MIFPAQFKTADDAVRTLIVATEAAAEARRQKEKAESDLANAEKGYGLALDALVAYGNATYLYGAKVVTVNRPTGGQATVHVVEPKMVRPSS